MRLDHACTLEVKGGPAVTAKGQLTSLENIMKHVGSGASEHEI